MCRVNYLSFIRLQNLHLSTNDADNADATDTTDDADDADNYNRVIGVAQPEGFQLAKIMKKTCTPFEMNIRAKDM